MTDAQINALIANCKQASGDPTKVDWVDLANVLSQIVAQQNLSDISNASDGNTLYYDADTQTWVPGAPIIGGGGGGGQLFYASESGILPGAGDITSALNTLLANSSIGEVVLDRVGNYQVSGTIQGNGKTVTFMDGAKLSGTVTLSNFKWRASLDSHIFPLSVTFQSVCRPSDIDHMSVKWFGAKGDNITDDQPAIQYCCDSVVVNEELPRKVFFPKGNYRIASPINIQKFNSPYYSPVTIWLYGLKGGNNNQFSAIIADYKDKFCIGIQSGKGCRIEHLHILGKGIPPSQSNPIEFWNHDYDTYGDMGGCRDTQYSPYAGIVVDPWGAYPPPDGGYPGMSSFYRGGETFSGSTSIIIESCTIYGFITGYVNSPAGQTLNAELLQINDCYFADCKICIAASQAQEKLNVVSNCWAWGSHWCFFMNTADGYGAGGSSVGYGVRSPGHWVIDGINIAGACIYFIHRTETAWFQMSIKNVYAELLRSFGKLNSNLGTTVENSIFDFVEYASIGTLPFYNVSAENTTFKGCMFRYYNNDNTQPIVIQGNPTFEDCYFICPPIIFNNEGRIDKDKSMLKRCTIGFEKINIDGTQTIGSQEGAYFYLSLSETTNFRDDLKYSTAGIIETFIPGKTVPLNGSIMIAVIRTAKNVDYVTVQTENGFDRYTTFTLSAQELKEINVGDTLMFTGWLGTRSQVKGFGRVSNVTGNVVKVSCLTPRTAYQEPGIVQDIPLFTYKWVAPKFKAFIGTTTTGSNVITNVITDKLPLNYYYPTEYLFIPGFEGYGYISWCRIVSVDINAKTITVDRPCNTTMVNRYFTNFGYTKEVDFSNCDLEGPDQIATYISGVFKDILVPSGAKLIFAGKGGKEEWIVTKCGYLDAAGSSSTLQAAWKSTRDMGSKELTLSDASTITWDYEQGDEAGVTIAGSRMLNIIGLPNRVCSGTLMITQDATGGHTLTLPSGKVNGTLNTAANAQTALHFRWNGTNFFFKLEQYA